MKKSNLTALFMGTIGTLCMGIGMSMALVEEWHLFQRGIVVGVIGILMLLLTVFVWRRMEHKPKLRLSVKGVETAALSIVGCVTLGIGMSLCLRFDRIPAGIVVGIVGIFLLLLLFPLIKSED